MTLSRAPISVCVLFLLSTVLPHHLSLGAPITCSGIVPMKHRTEMLSIFDFGAVGDGKTLNTNAFNTAIDRIRNSNNSSQGTLLHVPRGVYLTQSFNLTSHMTLYLADGAVIKAVQDTGKWRLTDPLPSYGRGRERPGRRYISFIHGDGLNDVVITGRNGTIDGQGEPWWNMWRHGTLEFTRPGLIEFKNSTNIVVSHVVLQNSAFWTLHPVYCSNVVVHHVTILAPTDSFNTDGIDPDSSSNVCIEDSYISTGDDLVAVKSGWDEYGIAYNLPSRDITIRRITGSSPFAGIAIGSETSGGIQNVTVENITLYNSGIGIHIKTNIGRGGSIQGITISGVYLEKVRTGIKISGDTGDHPDDKFNTSALPIVRGITIKNVWGIKVERAGMVQGLKDSPFTNLCFSNVTLTGTKSTPIWKCSDVVGAASKVNPTPCPELTTTTQQGGSCENQS
ncbi:unnamed protein product [Arabidopsis lyrata]|uniref:Glycoside hydrolase family 28 protein n=1 Tax=Arabidopsis lyrata subsp. lyrata TaxID=81972 RepID=D7MIQ6_ARALL|nr:probable polygalacturonase [Arabidopsis lyrata subsp. lyrata]EFH44831.1 glycoside hydrolase family 28 protein [Arabidopsis lyrata subsp. lyrata]CAH8277848.1 unnamed protein product [Arabidopsis lyrata]|eukprot:XP_002868572.1 probable polygalacturonase [Arabidopsis lyrata subsp. lyrata]